MIKINTNKFDWESINQVYGDENAGVIKDLTDLLEKYSEGNATNKNEKVIKIYKALFGERIEFEKVKDLLFNKEIETYIKEFNNPIQKNKNAMFEVIMTFYNLSPKVSIKKIGDYVKEKCSGMSDEADEFISQFYLCYNKNSEQKLPLEKRKNFIKDKYEVYFKLFQEQLEVSEIIEQHFNYENFAKSHRHKLISAMNVNVCPYCNRQYITSYKEKVTKTTADLDHFYPKKQYPFLALSLYNFVPSCQICNSRFKGTKNNKELPHLYPYTEEFGEDARFAVSSTSIDYLVSKSRELEFEIMVKYDEKDAKDNPDGKNGAIGRSITVFKLKDVYQVHKDYVKELIDKAMFYSESQRKEYLENFEGFFTSEEEILTLLFGNYVSEKDFTKRPLAKLTKDILDELGVRL